MTERESSSDVRRKGAALLLIFTVFAITVAIHRLPVPGLQSVTVPHPPSSVRLTDFRQPGLPMDLDADLAEPATASRSATPGRRTAALPVEHAASAVPVTVTITTPLPEPLPGTEAPPPADQPLASRPLWFQPELPTLALAQPAAAPYGSGIGAAGHAVGRAFGIAGRQIVTAFRRTGGAVKGAF